MSNDALVHDEIGWGDSDQTPRWGPAQSLLLVFASLSVWLPMWLIGGFPPLVAFLSRRAIRRR